MKIQKQRGMSLIGFVIVLSMVIFVSFLGMKIGPLYMEYYSVVSALNGVASERGSANLSPYDLRVKVLNRLYVSYSANVKEKHIKVTRGNGALGTRSGRRIWRQHGATGNARKTAGPSQGGQPGRTAQ